MSEPLRSRQSNSARLCPECLGWGWTGRMRGMLCPACKGSGKSGKRHPMDHGWIMGDGSYFCDGCNVRGVHEHRCHRDDGGLACACTICRQPTADELAAFRRELEADASGQEGDEQVVEADTLGCGTGGKLGVERGRHA